MPISPILHQSILELAGLSDLKGREADFAAAKILNDHEVLDVAAKCAAMAFAPDALRLFDAGQLARLRKRVQPEPAPSIQWMVGYKNPAATVDDINLYGELALFFIRAWIQRGTQIVEEIFYTGDPAQAQHFRFRGQAAPQDVLQRYAANWKPDPRFSPEVARAFGPMKPEKTHMQILHKELQKKAEAEGRPIPAFDDV